MKIVDKLSFYCSFFEFVFSFEEYDARDVTFRGNILLFVSIHIDKREYV